MDLAASQTIFQLDLADSQHFLLVAKFMDTNFNLLLYLIALLASFQFALIDKLSVISLLARGHARQQLSQK